MFSIIMPMDDDRFDQFEATKRAYDDAMDWPKEIIIPTRKHAVVSETLHRRRLTKDVKLLPYRCDEGFNPAHALNMGVRFARWDSIIVTCPEVKPAPDVLDRFAGRLQVAKRSDGAVVGVVGQVWLLDEQGNRLFSLVNTKHRYETPGFYFLAMYDRKCVEAINGWDERFMAGHAHEDQDFGNRWVRAGLPFEIADDIVGEHQWHPPHGELFEGANEINESFLRDNDLRGVIRCADGLHKLDEERKGK